MKKVVILFCLIISLGLVGCDSVPHDMDKNDYKILCNILDTVDEYLDGSLSATDAHSKINDLRKRIENKDNNIYTDNADSCAELISFEISKSDTYFSFDISMIKDKRNDLADTLKK